MRICKDLQDFCRSLQKFADLQNFYRSLQIFADLQNFYRSLQICADWKQRPTQEHKKPHGNVKCVIKVLRTAEKSHSYQNDETFFCSNLYKSVKNFTELYSSIKNLNAGYVVLKSTFLVLYHWNWNAADLELVLGANSIEAASGTQLVRATLEAGAVHLCTSSNCWKLRFWSGILQYLRIRLLFFLHYSSRLRNKLLFSRFRYVL